MYLLALLNQVILGGRNSIYAQQAPIHCLNQWCHSLMLPLGKLYRKTSSISRTKSQNLNVSNLVVQLSLLNPLKPGVKSRMKM